jgi:predicted metal-dependent hydrolase
MNFEFPKQIDRYWFGNSPFKTHLFNSFTLLLPDAEQYIIRNVGRQLKQINKPQLKQEVREFISQEGQHSSQHTKFWDNLRLQGYEIDTYTRFVRAIFLNTLERRLSIS